MLLCPQFAKVDPIIDSLLKGMFPKIYMFCTKYNLNVQNQNAKEKQEITKNQ